MIDPEVRLTGGTRRYQLPLIFSHILLLKSDKAPLSQSWRLGAAHLHDARCDAIKGAMSNLVSEHGFLFLFWAGSETTVRTPTLTVK